MTGTEPIRFGVSGFWGKGEIPIREFTKFAQSIKSIDELYDALGGKNNVDKKYQCVFESMFNQLAGEDKEIDANEIFGFFKQLDKAAERNGATTPTSMDILNDDELYKEMKENGIRAKISNKTISAGVLGWMFGLGGLGLLLERAENSYDDKVGQKKAMHQFVEALVKVNDKKVADQEAIEAAERAAQEAAEKADLEARTTYDKYGNKTIKDKENPDNSVTYNKDDKKIKEVTVVNGHKYIETLDPNTGETVDWKHIGPREPETYYYRDENGAVIEKEITEYYNDGTRKRERTYDRDNKLICERLYDGKGNETYRMKVNPFTIAVGNLNGTETSVKNKDESWDVTGVDSEGKTLYTGTEKTRPNGDSEHVTKFSDGKIEIKVFDGNEKFNGYRIFHEDLNGNLISENIENIDTNTFVTRCYKDGKVYIEEIYEHGKEPKYYYKGQETTREGYWESKRNIRLYYSNQGVKL